MTTIKFWHKDDDHPTQVKLEGTSGLPTHSMQFTFKSPAAAKLFQGRINADRRLANTENRFDFFKLENVYKDGDLIVTIISKLDTVKKFFQEYSLLPTDSITLIEHPKNIAFNKANGNGAAPKPEHPAEPPASFLTKLFCCMR